VDTPKEAGAHLNKLHEAVWELAAVSLVLREPASVDPDLRDAAGRVVIEAGLGSAEDQGVQPAHHRREVTFSDEDQREIVLGPVPEAAECVVDVGLPLGRPPQEPA